MLCSYLYYTTFYRLIQLLFCPSSITCVNSMDASYIPIAEARGFTTHWISKFSTHRVEILQYLNYFLNLYFPFPWPDTGSIISACTKLERCFEAPDDPCFHQIIIACKRRFIIYNLCKKTATFLHVFQSKTCFCLGIISHSFISKELSLNLCKQATLHQSKYRCRTNKATAYHYCFFELITFFFVIISSP